MCRAERPCFQTVHHFDLAFLTRKHAWELNDRRIVFRVDLDSRPDERDGSPCVSSDPWSCDIPISLTEREAEGTGPPRRMRLPSSKRRARPERRR
jgi:hypothetical protein